jgi:hypothetical protein
MRRHGAERALLLLAGLAVWAPAAQGFDCTAPLAEDPAPRRAALLLDFLESPFAPGPPGGRAGPPVVIPGRWQERSLRASGIADELTEGILLEWFSRLGARPTVTSELWPDPQESRQRETRTWSFPGAKVAGDVAPATKHGSGATNTLVYLRRLEFTDERYPLACGLRVGVPAARLVELFGPSRVRSAHDPSGLHRYCEMGACPTSEDAARSDVATFEVDPASGRISRIEVFYPRRH